MILKKIHLPKPIQSQNLIPKQQRIPDLKKRTLILIPPQKLKRLHKLQLFPSQQKTLPPQRLKLTLFMDQPQILHPLQCHLNHPAELKEQVDEKRERKKEHLQKILLPTARDQVLTKQKEHLRTYIRERELNKPVLTLIQTLV